MVTILAEDYQIITEAKSKIEEILQDLETLIKETPKEVLVTTTTGQGMVVILSDACLQVDAFDIERALKRLSEKREIGIEVDEDICAAGREAIAAAEKMRADLRKQNLIVNTTLQKNRINKENAEKATKNIIQKYSEEMNKIYDIKKEISAYGTERT